MKRTRREFDKVYWERIDVPREFQCLSCGDVIKKDPNSLHYKCKCGKTHLIVGMDVIRDIGEDVWIETTYY